MPTYRDAGVDLDAADAVVRAIGHDVTRTWGDRVVGGFGGFAAGLRLPPGFADPVLMMSTDGVGTKADLARRSGLVDGLGWDLVAMCIDDLVATGATPIAMTDYIAVGRLEPELVARLVRSIAAACAEAKVALLGGETAEHPGVMEPGAFDLAGAALGVVENGAQIGGTEIVAGDVLIGLLSPNLRSNGFSLVRHAVVATLGLEAPLPGTGRSVAEAVMEPSVLYTPAVLALLGEVPVRGMAHVTGGGIAGNLRRVLPHTCDAVVETDAWVPPAVFAAVQQVGNVPGADMFATFNMGVGFIAVVAAADADAAVAALDRAGRPAGVIGEVVTGDGMVRLA